MIADRFRLCMRFSNIIEHWILLVKTKTILPFTRCTTRQVDSLGTSCRASLKPWHLPTGSNKRSGIRSRLGQISKLVFREYELTESW